MSLHVVVLAAGQGTRMKSDLPKVMHRLAGKALAQHVVDTASLLAPQRIHLVYGHQGELVKKGIASDLLIWVEQQQQLGTGHAVAQALPGISEDAQILILYGDVPLIAIETLRQFVSESTGKLGVLTLVKEDATGYGRIVRNSQGQTVAIVEQKDASEAQQSIKEINTGIMSVTAKNLKKWLPELSNDNAQGEYYLTDIVAKAVEDGIAIVTLQPENSYEVDGVNNRVQLAELERALQHKLATQLMLQGVSLADPARVDVRGELQTGPDVEIDVNCVFEGAVSLGQGVKIGPNCVLKNCSIGRDTIIEAFSHIEGSEVASEVSIGPYARLRPGTRLAEKSKVGNFVETKKSTIGVGSKINHLSYVGDTQMGNNVNVGAGTITCNYDGVNKSVTNIGDDVFVGSNSSLVAPVNIGSGATIGAGSAVGKSVGPGQLAITRAKQRNVDKWRRPQKKT